MTVYLKAQQISSKKVLLFVAALVIAATPLLYINMISAAALTQVFVRFDRLATSTVTTGTVCAKPSTTSVDVKSWSVTFPAGFTLGAPSTFQSTNISTTNLAWPTGGAAWPSAASATVAIVGQVVTWTVSSAQSMNNTTLYCYNWLNTTGNAVTTNSVATPTNLGTVTTTDSTSTTIDTAQYDTTTIANDQVLVTATVPAAFSFSLSGNADPLGSLSAASVAHSNPTPQSATISTNAKNGWQVWAKDSSAGLASTATSHTIPANAYNTTPTTVTAGTEGYNTGVQSSHSGGTGAITVDPGFVYSLNTGGGLSTTLHTIATSNGTAGTDTLSFTNNVAISSITPAATDYKDTITIIGAGLF